MSETDKPEGPGGPRDHHNELAQWALEAQPEYGRKLTFSEQCGIAYALKSKGVRSIDVRAAFGLSAATVSWLKHCLQPGRPHYREVWQEYQGLGPEAFKEKYYTRELHGRLVRVRHGLKHLDDNQTDIVPKAFGPDPRADKYSLAKWGPITLDDESTWGIVWEEEPAGWYFKELRNPKLYGAESLRGAIDPEPFRTSTNAYDGLYERNGYESPRARPGRPKNNSDQSS